MSSLIWVSTSRFGLISARGASSVFEMVAVKMRDQNEVDIVARDTLPLQCRQRRCAAIDQEIDARAGNVKTGVGPAAGAESVAAADKLQLHRPDPPELTGQELLPERSAQQRRITQRLQSAARGIEYQQRA